MQADTTSYADSSAVLGTITTLHLAVIAVFALLAILAITWGVRMRARRKAGEAEVEARNLTVERAVAPPTEAPTAGEPVEARLPEEVGRIARPSLATPTDPVPAPAPRPEPTVEPARAPEPDVAPEPSPLADEPIAAAAPMDASPASIAADLETPEPAPAPAAAAAPTQAAPAYRLTDLKGLGPKVAARLTELGIDTVPALAALDDDRAAALSAQLGPFAGRMERDRWREQAKLLAAGDRAGFEAAFGKL